MINVAVSPVLHVERCRTRPGSIVVGHLHTVLVFSARSLWLSTCYCSFCFLWYQNCSRPCFLSTLVCCFTVWFSGVLLIRNTGCCFRIYFVNFVNFFLKRGDAARLLGGRRGRGRREGGAGHYSQGFPRLTWGQYLLDKWDPRPPL